MEGMQAYCEIGENTISFYFNIVINITEGRPMFNIYQMKANFGEGVRKFTGKQFGTYDAMCSEMLNLAVSMLEKTSIEFDENDIVTQLGESAVDSIDDMFETV